MSASPVRLGVLAASRIAERAVIEPVGRVDGVELTAVGARHVERARAAADRWGAQRAFGSYPELLACDEVDAVYIGTPAALHRPWAVAAIESGKHVLVEKPFASNATDARRIADAAAAHPGVVVMEAFHWRYHPVADRITAIVRSGVLGRVTRAEGVFDIPDGVIPRTDIRWDLRLGGGATMDLGCYSIQWVRHAVAADLASGGDVSRVPDVVTASAVVPEPGIDASLVAELRWPSGATGSVGSSMVARGSSLVARLVVTGSDGSLVVVNPLAPQTRPSELRVLTAGGLTVEQVADSSTYAHQLVAFRDAIVDSTPFPTTAEDAVRNMQVVDACYRAAGLEPRPSLDG